MRMSIYNVREITDSDMLIISSYMEDDIRETVHANMAPCSNEEFLEAYLEMDPLFLVLLEVLFGLEVNK